MTLRWALKRGFRSATMWGFALTGGAALYRLTPAYRTGYRILTYHRVAKRAEDSFTVTEKDFRDQMAYLSDHAEVIELGELVKRIAWGRVPAGLTVALTFDDGFAELAGPVGEELKRRRLPATFFVITSMLDRETNKRSGTFVTWDQARTLAAAGFSIGSHSVTHRSLVNLADEDVRRELVVSRERITREVGVAPRALSYPYGTVRDFSPEVARAVWEAGYHYAVTAVNGLNRFHFNPFTLRRTALMAGEGLRTFRMILKGDLDPWVLVDRWAYRFQRPDDGAWGPLQAHGNQREVTRP